jgi:hypothetical protein
VAHRAFQRTFDRDDQVVGADLMLACPAEEPKTAASSTTLALTSTPAFSTDLAFAPSAPETNDIDNTARVAHNENVVRAWKIE